MRRLTREALAAGAFGFTTSRSESHRTTSGELVPGRNASPEELLAIGAEIGEAGRGAFGMLSDFEDEPAEFAWMSKLAREIRRPIWFLLTDRATDPERWRRLMAGVHRAREQGAQLTAQVAGRPVGLILGLLTSLNPFTAKPSFHALAPLPAGERLRRLKDPAVRAAILAEESSEKLLAILPPLLRAVATRWDRMYVLGDPPDYEPAAERSLAAMAAREGRSAAEFAYDYLTAGDGDRMLFFPVTNYVTGDHEVVRALMTDPATVHGLSDGGAHCGLICDSSTPTYMLTHWARDRRRGEKLPLEWLVKRQTSETADFFGFHDRGRLKPGLKADLNLIDFDRLRVRPPELVHDLPANGRRLVQRAEGYEMTMVSGVPVMERGERTGEFPGKLVRAGDPAVAKG